MAAQLYARLLRDVKTIVTSPLVRAVQTAEEFSKVLSVPIVKIEGLREWNLGDWDQQPWDSVPDLFTREDAPPNGESSKDLDARVGQALIQVFQQPVPSLIIGHSGIWYSIQRLLGLPSERVDRCVLYRFDPPANELGGWSVFSADNDAIAGKSIPNTDKVIAEFGNVAALAAIYELRLRLLADKTPEMHSKSHARLEEVEEAFLARFSAILTPSGIQLIQEGRRLRNKLLHAEFSVAAEKIELLRPGNLQKGGVTFFKLNEEISEDSVKKVSDTHSKESGIFGWLWEAQLSGLFHQCRIIFSQMIGIVAQITHETAMNGAKDK